MERKLNCKYGKLFSYVVLSKYWLVFSFCRSKWPNNLSKMTTQLSLWIKTQNCISVHLSFVSSIVWREITLQLKVRLFFIFGRRVLYWEFCNNAFNHLLGCSDASYIIINGSDYYIGGWEWWMCVHFLYICEQRWPKTLWNSSLCNLFFK
jgi:hypothetical protein